MKHTYDSIIKVRKLDHKSDICYDNNIPCYKCSVCKTRMYEPFQKNEKCPVCGSIESYEMQMDNSGMFQAAKIVILVINILLMITFIVNVLLWVVHTL